MIKMEIPQLMREQFKQAKEIIDKSKNIKVYSHIDCDGIIRPACSRRGARACAVDRKSVV